jgi:hypothetical protein
MASHMLSRRRHTRMKALKTRHSEPRCPEGCSGGRLSARWLRDLLPGEIDAIGVGNLPAPDLNMKLGKCTYCSCVWIQPRAAIIGDQARILGFMANMIDGSGWHPASPRHLSQTSR